MTQKQAEYLVTFDGREFSQAGESSEHDRQVRENLVREISSEEMDELIANYPDFPRSNEVTI
jgi:hypothetical protein